MKRFLCICLLLTCANVAQAANIPLTDGRSISATGNTVRPQTPFGLFDASVNGSGSTSKQNSVVDFYEDSMTGFHGTMQVLVDLKDTAVAGAQFVLTFRLEDARAYDLTTTLVSHLSGASTFYRLTLNGQFNQNGNLGNVTLNVNKTGVLEPGDYTFILFTDAEHSPEDVPRGATLTSDFRFQLFSVPDPAPVPIALVFMWIVWRKGRREIHFAG